VIPKKQAATNNLTIRVLGEFQVLRTGKVEPLPQSRKTRALLAYLVLTGRRHRRDRLCEFFWEVPDDPRGALRWSLTKLRSLANDAHCERIVADRDYVSFEPKGATVDLLEIRREMAGGAESLSTKRLVELAEQFRGDLLEGLFIPDNKDFASWLLTERDAARRTRASLLHVLVGRLCDGEKQGAANHGRDLVATDPFSVSAHALYVRALLCEGRRDEAARQREIGLKELREAGARDLAPLIEAAAPRGGLAAASTPSPPPVSLEQEVRFCTTSDGVRIAYATVGKGPPLIKCANWLNHLEYDWDSPIWRHVFRGLAKDHRFIRYDPRGNGLSDWDVHEFSFEALVQDLESVVEAAGVERFPLLGISQGCAISIEYAIRNPGRVTRLILHGGYAAGWRASADPKEIARREAMRTLVLHGWGQNNPAFRQMFTSGFIPEGTPEQFQWMNELLRVCVSPENATRLQDVFGRIDVRDRLKMVNVPTLVLHSRGDGRIPYERGIELARGIPNARLVTFESNNHLLLEHEPEFPRFLSSILKFLDAR
jgi:pimeloyl-ACP methyl ester carboxylesterase/DNA-binding SARP family transcriptional activator